MEHGAGHTDMRLPIIFAAFFLGLLTQSPSTATGSPWIDFASLGAMLIAFVFLASRRVLALTCGCIIAFLLGMFWMSNLPTWPRPLMIDQLPADQGCSTIGTAVSEAFSCHEGRYIPLSIETVRAEGVSRSCAAVQGPWKRESGTVLAAVERGFVGVSGARYRVHGILVTDPEQLHAPILLRYRSRATIEPGITGVQIEQIDPPGISARILSRLRYSLMSHLSWGLSELEGELVAGITFGRKGRRIGGDWAKDFYHAGISHLIVASGAQVSLLFFPLFFLLGRIRLPTVIKCLLLGVAAAALVGFARLLGGEPSILRAAAMGCVLLVAIGLGRRTFGLATLSAAGFFWLMQNPLLARDSGFLLSFGASFGIIYLSPVFLDRLRMREPSRRFRFQLDSMKAIGEAAIRIVQSTLRLFLDWTVVTVAAQIGVLPILACTIGRLSLVGFVANLFAVPVAQIILYLGALSGIGGYISPVVSLNLNRVLAHLAQLLMDIARDFSGLPYANTPMDPLPAWVTILWYAALIGAVEVWRIRSRRRASRKAVRKRQYVEPDPASVLMDPDKPLPEGV